MGPEGFEPVSQLSYEPTALPLPDDVGEIAQRVFSQMRRVNRRDAVSIKIGPIEREEPFDFANSH